jgi:hypothetical protein
VDEPEGYPRVSGEDGVAPTTTVLATADLRDWVAGGKAGMATISLLVRNGRVFNAATVSWQDGLATDGDIQRITRNVVSRLRSRATWSAWEKIGHANSVTAMTALDGKLWCSTSDDRLWRRFPMGADAPWTAVGHARDVCAMASAAGWIWALTSDNLLWRRRPVDHDVDWEPVGQGPTPPARSIAGTAFLLYAIDVAGETWVSPATKPLVWRDIPDMSAAEPAICATAAYEDVLFAATTDGRLLRTMPDFVFEASRWTAVHHCNFATGLAVVDTMLYVATTENLLWWLDLRSVAKP